MSIKINIFILFIFSSFILFQLIYSYTKCIKTNNSGCDNIFYPCCDYYNTICKPRKKAKFAYGKCIEKIELTTIFPKTKCINDSNTRCDDKYNKCCSGLNCNRDTHEIEKHGTCI
ncbi:hypothetical protein ACQ4LE_010236 [Meloidogyne hapla]